MSHKRIHPIDLMANKTADICILDVRTTAEVNAASLADCLHIPLHELTPERLRHDIEKSGKNGSRVYLLCQGGKRAEMAADQLKGQINAELVIIEGGINAVKQSNIPLRVTSKKTISLERQVRIAAGVLILIGMILGTWFNPGFYVLSAFVGAGLVFAGISDICAMGMLIAKAPWNR
ncbi:rhodanese-like domain-containing protein [Cellvibrio japonicus]|uniref:Sulfurtransferase n=1 Tax=Cellvibrio japonicus (strain Ueda107) TaxID=498211 RepID=B3PD09_CELJU|nr:rhodanese-like domain-containing protein [Cellvibrio japonicus]ACE82752.1 sulfurtransferase [Cellvibrio japonicus Ueda107]QEI11949.1 rhodanese-like domain-containing protein [Cellvibrio japonicus]QEI15523.1 rhodanese-like domain-containing protein [Cellvibrio japonicus]QEI19102.1 rhodanese-like domain-containing protein [Cellvibrio japonicus]